MIRHQTQIRVRYADTDQMKMVYYGKYFEYFEQARSEMLRAVGFPYSEIEKSGIWLPVIEAFAKYRRSARYDDMITVESLLDELPVARVRISYKIFVGDDREAIVEGYTVHSFLNASTGKPTRAPAQFLQVLEEAFQEHAETRTS